MGKAEDPLQPTKNNSDYEAAFLNLHWI